MSCGARDERERENTPMSKPKFDESEKFRTRLAAEDPHPYSGSKLVADWWGKEIQVGRPHLACRNHPCGTMYIYQILGPPQLLMILHKNKLGRFVCEHQLGGMRIEHPAPRHTECGDRKEAGEWVNGKRYSRRVQNLNLADLAESQETSPEA